VCLFFLVCLVWLQDALRAAGAFPVLVATLTAHQGHAGVAEQACIALGHLSPAALVEALKAHQGHAGVAEQACIALGYLAAFNTANQVTSMGGGRNNPSWWWRDDACRVAFDGEWG
jgi:hypothetical protein